MYHYLQNRASFGEIEFRFFRQAFSVATKQCETEFGTLKLSYRENIQDISSPQDFHPGLPEHPCQPLLLCITICLSRFPHTENKHVFHR